VLKTKKKLYVLIFGIFLLVGAILPVTINAQTADSLLTDLPQQPETPRFIYSIWLGRGRYTNEELDKAFRIAHNLGLKYFRVEFKWSYVEPENNQWNWDNEGVLDVESLIDLAKQYDITIIPYFNIFMPWGEKIEVEPGRWQHQAPDPDEYAEFVFEVVNKLRNSGVDVRYIELDNEVSGQNDGYQCWNPYINVTARELKEAQNAAYDKVKATYPDVMVSTTTFGFPGLSCVPEGQGPDCEIDKERRNSFVKAYFEDDPKPKFDFIGIHEVFGGSGNPWTAYDKPADAGYEYNFGSYNDAYDIWRDILDKYGYTNTPIFNLESGAVRAGKQDIDLLQKVIFARTQAEENNIIGWAVVQLLESKFTASKPGAGTTLSQGFVSFEEYELREGYYGYYTMMSILPNYPNYEENISGELNTKDPWVEKFSNDDGDLLYAAFIPYHFGTDFSQTISLEIGLDKEVKITNSDTTISIIQSDSNGYISLEVGESPVFIEEIESKQIKPRR
jgi:hypothetical protein